jgi:hypothetical protein
MTNITREAAQFKNAESPFTEILALAQRHQVLSKICLIEDIKVITQHLNNIMDTLFQGLQSIGRLIAMLVSDNKKVTEELINVGSLVTLISNLAEASNSLRLDADYVMKLRGEIRE